MKFSNVTIGYSHKNILKNLSLTIAKGDFVFLIGDSGSGKTSFIKSLIGELSPKSGSIINHAEKNIYTMKQSELLSYRRSIWVIFQDYKLLGSKTVRENVAFAMEVCGYPDSKILHRISEVLSQVNILVKKDKFPSELSWWEAQRVAIARALIHNPDTIIGDEPTGNLDPKTAEGIFDIFLDLNKQGKTIIIATHDEKIVNKLKKRVITFRDGAVVSDVKEGVYAN